MGKYGKIWKIVYSRLLFVFAFTSFCVIPFSFYSFSSIISYLPTMTTRTTKSQSKLILCDFISTRTMRKKEINCNISHTDDVDTHFVIIYLFIHFSRFIFFSNSCIFFNILPIIFRSLLLH